MSYFTNVIPILEGHNHFLPFWLKAGSSVTLVLLILNGWWRKRKPVSPEIETNDDNGHSKSSIKVNGMTCSHCQNAVEGALKNIDGIDEAKANFNSGEVIISGESIDLETVKSSINEMGYEYVEESS